MVPVGEGGEISSPGGTRRRSGVAVDGDVDCGARAGQNVGGEAGNRKRKASVTSRDSKRLVGNAEDSELECEVSRRILVEIENLRSQLDEDVKQLGYCEENEKLRVEMDLKDKEIQCLRKQIEEIQAQYEKQHDEPQSEYEKKNMKQNEKLQAKFDKQNEELEAMYEKKDQELKSKNEELQFKYEEQKDELQSKYEEWIEELLAKYEKRNKKVYAKYTKLNKELKANHEKQTKELQAEYEGLHKNVVQILENQIDVKRKQLWQLEGLYSTVDALATDESCDEDANYKLVHESSGNKTDVNRNAADEKSKLELEVANLDTEIQIKIGNLGEILESEKFSEELYSVTMKSFYDRSSKELLAIRKRLIQKYEDLNGKQELRTAIGIKRMGELDENLFLNSCKRKYGTDCYQTKAAQLVANWQEEIKNPNWHPFKIIKPADGPNKEVINDDDAKLKYLCIEYGDDVCNAVKTALMELNEYNPSGRYTVPDLWDFSKGRMATETEALNYLFRQMEKRRSSVEGADAPCGLGL
ncbi:hypothetical protein PR202_gb26457 [Eleusine coracana subsp. coracana]|uniref:Factor of DNA methylation 1-5/IDN2 domain-containing protein n=1 Tax=Eleusine coracana subsp. coracana TaxID=191504 RepID=A0AAV5FRX2_ELECO|nr:hypothetical protein PR202_gb26457 [Eleusine coracana subsp. coracana]